MIVSPPIQGYGSDTVGNGDAKDTFALIPQSAKKSSMTIASWRDSGSVKIINETLEATSIGS
jgi:hypothetical protein